MNVRNLLIPLLLLALPAAAAEPAKALDPAALDPAVKPCEDFYQYANGSWIKANPVPADKARWGAFEELGERNRAVLKSIVEETSARTDWPKGSVRQKVGDFYASGMDEAAIERAGLKPLEPWMKKIEALQGTDDLPVLLATLHLGRLPSGFGFMVAQDQKNSTRYIPSMGQGGLGLPDRDYYLKDDPKSKSIREKYVAHVAKLLELAGDAPEAAKASADAILFCCSAFGPAIDECRKQVSIPILKPNEALYEQLVAKSGNVSLLATFQPSLPSMLAEIAACAKEKGTSVNVAPHLVDGALQALLDLQPDEHNRLIAEAAAKQQACDVIALAQFSMAPAKTLAATRTKTPILTTPDSAVAKLKVLLA